VGSSPNPVSFSASGLDVGYLSATSSSEATVNYQ
jgi:hypothetical protein